MADLQNGTGGGDLAAGGVVRRVVRVPKEHAAFLYFHLEAEDGICSHSTLDPPRGAPWRDVEVTAHPSTAPDLDRSLRRLGRAVPLEFPEEG